MLKSFAIISVSIAIIIGSIFLLNNPTQIHDVDNSQKLYESLVIIRELTGSENVFLFRYDLNDKKSNLLTLTLSADGIILQRNNNLVNLGRQNIAISPDISQLFQGKCSVTTLAETFHLAEYRKIVLRCPLYKDGSLIGHYGITNGFLVEGSAERNFQIITIFSELLSLLVE